MTNPAEGWAIDRDGEIIVATIGPTKRSAMVNFLVAETGTMVFVHNTDDEIEAAFEKRRGAAIVVGVRITAWE